jgi:chemotaxis methyl-accepting protein methylase
MHQLYQYFVDLDYKAQNIFLSEDSQFDFLSSTLATYARNFGASNVWSARCSTGGKVSRVRPLNEIANEVCENILSL